MRWVIGIVAALMMAAVVGVSQAAESGHAPGAVIQAAGEAAAHGADAAHAEHHGLPEAAPRLHHLGPIPITNSMVAMILVTVLIITVAQVGMRAPKLVPSGLQNFVEWVVESLHEFLSGILGHKLALQTFWYFATVFIFILFANWFGLLPGVGSITYGGDPILRGANADLNMTGAMAMIFFVAWIYWSVKNNGVGGFLGHIFGYHGDATGGMKAFLILIFFAVGILEVVSILFRPVSLSFRLYGNVFAGENLLETMLIGGGVKFGWLVGLPFLMLELLIGFVQALVFTLLTAIFTSMMCSHADDHAAESHAEHAH